MPWFPKGKFGIFKLWFVTGSIEGVGGGGGALPKLPADENPQIAV